MRNLRASFTRSQVERREELILEQAVHLLSRIRGLPKEEIPYFLIYGILDWSWCLRFVKGNELYRGFRYYSAAALSAMEAGEKKFARDHVVPKRFVKDLLLALPEPSFSSVREILTEFGEVCVITRQEDGALRAAGLTERMPSDWSRGHDPFARYGAVGIESVENRRLFG